MGKAESDMNCPKCGIMKEPTPRGQQRGQWYPKPRPEVVK